MLPSVTAMIISLNGENRIMKTVESIRQIVEDIVVFIDARTTDRTVEILQKNNVRHVQLEESGFFETLQEKAVRMIDSDWILRIDDDELIVANEPEHVTPELFRFYLKHLGESGYGVGRICRRWVLPGMTHFISSATWWPDMQARLFLNKPDKIAWPTEIHREPVFPGGTVLVAQILIDHLDFIYNDYEARVRKVSNYFKERPNRSGGEIYLFEKFSFTTSPLKPIDRPTLLATARQYIDFTKEIENVMFSDTVDRTKTVALPEWKYSPLTYTIS